MTEWRVVRARGAVELPIADERTVRVHVVERPMLVLGRVQSLAAVVDRAAAAAAGVDVVTRPSGGGAVLLEPGNALWLDAFVPRRDDLWDDDVGRAAWWLGDAWARAIGGAARVHRGPMVRTRWSDLVCFAGLGAGEVTAGEGGPKLVGVSQRRTAAGAWFQCAAMAQWDPVGVLALLDLSPEAREEAADALVTAANGLPIPLAEAEGRVLDALAAD